tara:strand:+ start:325 stop:903 length:579 start_codon:yes stop_codon:yes gene_type:complete
MQVLDNIFPIRLVDEIERAMLHVDTPWQYASQTYGRDKQLRKGEVEEPQLVHAAFFEGDGTYLWPLLSVPLYFIEKEIGRKIVNIQRCKVNTLMHTPLSKETDNHPIHADRHEQGWHSIIYYVTEGDSPTVFTDSVYPNLENPESAYNIVERVQPKKGRVVIFPSDIYHSSSPTQLSKRIAANYVVKFEEEK